MQRPLILTLGFGLLACATPHVLADDAARSAATGKPLIVEMTASWCQPCRTFETEVLGDDRVKAELEGVHFVRADLEDSKGRRIAKRYNVRTVPTFLVIGPEQEILLGHVGALTADEFLALLRWSGQNARRARVQTSEPPAPGSPNLVESEPSWTSAPAPRSSPLPKL